MEFIYLATFAVAFLSSILSGIAGSGGGYIMAPYWLVIGMTPAQAASAGGFIAVGVGASSLAAFRVTNHFPKNKRLTWVLIGITAIAATAGALVLPYIHTASFEVLLGIITILSIPMLFINRRAIKLGKRYRIVGIGLLVLLLLTSSVVTSSAFSILIAVGLSQLFNLTILQSIALRRVVGLVQSGVLFAGLALQGNLLLPHAIIALIGGSIGSYIGTKLSIRGGEKFAKYALAIGALIGASALLV